MNPNRDHKESSDQNVPTVTDDSAVQDSQVNPLTMMTSSPLFIPVADDQENVLELTDVQALPGSTVEADVSVPDLSIPSAAVTNSANNHSVAAWVEATTQETGQNPIERSPSLPSTLLEATEMRDRRNSNVSTLCEQQLSSIVSDTLSSQQPSVCSDMQRSQSVPNRDPYHSDDDEPSEDDRLKTAAKSGEDDEPLQFLPVPESEESEVDKKTTKQPLAGEESMSFDSRSPTTRDSPKRSPNVSFRASSHKDTEEKPSITDRQRRRNSWNTNKTKPPSFQRSQSHYNAVIPPLAPSSSLHSRILRKQFCATLSMPNGPRPYSRHPTHQSSELSDQVFLSQSHSNSSRDRPFLAIPSSTSAISSERMTSLISDASGQSGIESTNLRSSMSDQARTSSFDELDNLTRRNRFRDLPRKGSSTSKHSSTTPSTQSLTSSSDDDMHHSARKNKRAGGDQNGPEAATDKRRQVVRQLKWLLEKKPTIYGRFGVGGHRKGGLEPSSSTNKQHSHSRKSTPNSFVEFCTSFQSSNAQNAILRTETEVPPRSPARLYSSANTPLSIRHSLPVQPIIVNTDPMNESYSSIKSVHSDLNSSTSLINSRAGTQADLPTTISLHSSLQPSRRRTSHRRNLTGLAATTRDRKNSLTKAELSIVSQSSQQDDEDSPHTPNLTRSIEAILNEHLVKINKLLENQSWNTTLPYPAQPSSMRDGVYTRLHELSQQNLMHRRCSGVETKAFIDLITDFQMNRSHHYRHLGKTIQDSFIAINEPARASTTSFSENEDEAIKDGHLASNESSNMSSPVLTRLTSTESNYASNADDQLVLTHPLRCFRTLSEEYILDCERTEQELTKLFDQADQQHILYCLKHDQSGHSNDNLVKFHRQLEALFLWYNLYYELTLAVTKLSRLLRCHACDDWPKLHFRSLATLREMKAKEAAKNNIEDSTTDESSAEAEATEESEAETRPTSADDNIGYDSDIIPKSRWPDEPMDSLAGLEISQESNSSEPETRTRNLDRIDCYQNFIHYMDKRAYQAKYDSVARTLIEPVASVLFKTRLALLHGNDRQKIRMEQIFAGVPCNHPRTSAGQQSGAVRNTFNDVSDEKLLNTNHSTLDDPSLDMNTGDFTIEKWLFHILKSSSTIESICASADEILKENWFELHQQLGLPSLLPFYFFIINVLLDVMKECVILSNKPHTNKDLEIDSLCRQQLVRDAKLVLRNSLVIRLYAFRMLEQFIPLRTIVDEFDEFDSWTLKLYTDYKQFLSIVCNNRIYGAYEDADSQANKNTDLYFYVDEETSELIKEYYFARDLTLTLRNRTETHDLCIQFSTLIKQILMQLREELNAKTEVYYQTFALDMNDPLNSNDGTISAQVQSDVARHPSFHASASVPANLCHSHDQSREDLTWLSDRRRKEIIDRTRLFRAGFDTIKQRATRVCSLAKTLIDDFSIAAEFKCSNYQDFWQQIQKYSYVQVKTYPSPEDSGNFDNFYVFVPPWLSTDPDQVDQLLSIVCSQQVSSDDLKKNEEQIKPSFMIFVPEKSFQRLMKQWTGEILYIQPNESTKLALNSTELSSLHLIVNRFDHWSESVKLFQSHAGLNNIALRKKLARFEAIRSTFDQLPEHIDRLSTEITDLVRTLNSICDQGSTRLYFKELFNLDQRAIESKLIDLVLYVYKSGFDLFRLLYDLIPAISSNHDELLKKSVKTMNEFFCEWCKCVAKKFKCASLLQTRAANYKVLKPRWLMPGMFFLRFLASSTHLQLLSDEDFEKLITGIPAALDMRHSSMRSSQNSPTNKDFTFLSDRLSEDFVLARSSSASSPSGQGSRSGGHRRMASGGRAIEIVSSTPLSVSERIVREFNALEQRLENKLRERKQIGQIHGTDATTNASSLDPIISLKTRNIDFPWRRGTRIGQGGAGIAFRAINCSNGSIVCMKEILLSSISARSLPTTYLTNLRQIADEIDMIMTIAHPNIVRYFGIERYKRTIYICMEYCLSTVNEFLSDIRAFERRADKKRKTSSIGDDSDDQEDELKTDEHSSLTAALNINEHVRRFVKQLLHALMSLHELRIVHCDVKGDNIFIANENGHYIVKLGDFNLSHRFGLDSSSPDGISYRSTQTGTLYFKPPEPEYVFASDIWALGCTIIEMLTGKLPWTHLARPPGGDLAYIHGQLSMKKGPPIPEEIRIRAGPEAYDFIVSCLQPDVENRPTARELLNYSYPRVRTDS